MDYNVDLDSVIKFNHQETPIWWQQEYIHRARKAKYLGLISSRQTGKTWLGRALIKDFLFRYDIKKNPVGLCVMTNAEQVKKLYVDNLETELQDIPQDLWQIRHGASMSILTLHRPWFKDKAVFIFRGYEGGFRGLTTDFIMVDEMAFFKKDDLYTKILSPMLDRNPKSKLYITSTVEGDTPFTDLFDLFLEKSKTSSRYHALEQDIYEAKTLSSIAIQEKIEQYKALGKHDDFLQEYMNDRTVKYGDVFPFKKPVADARKEGRFSDLDSALAGMPFINVSMDIGKAGNAPMWSWTKAPGGQILVTDYDDGLKGFDNVCSYLYAKYANKYQYVNLFLPHDVRQSSVDHGDTRYNKLLATIQRMGLSRFIRPDVIPKTTDKELQYVNAIAMFNKCKFNERSCKDGLDKIKNARWRQDQKTKQAQFGKWVDTGDQHAVDAFRYIYESLHLAATNRYVNMNEIRSNTFVPATYVDVPNPWRG